jgi:hypothetical protein
VAAAEAEAARVAAIRPAPVEPHARDLVTASRETKPEPAEAAEPARAVLNESSLMAEADPMAHTSPLSGGRAWRERR